MRKKKCPLNISFFMKDEWRSFATSLISLGIGNKTNDFLIKKMISQNIAERPLNTTSILKNFKSFIKLLYQKEWRQNNNKKENQNNYLRAATSQTEEKLLTLQLIHQIHSSQLGKSTLFLNSNFYKNKFANTYMSYEILTIIFVINTLKLF